MPSDEARDEGQRIILDGLYGPEVEIAGERLVYFGGTSYFAMGAHPQVVEALRHGLARWGIGVGAGRTTSGTTRPHLDLEAALTRLLESDCVVLAPNGYQANAVILQALRDRYDACLIDETGHSSLRDAALGSGLPATTFRHLDPEDLERVARDLRGSGKRVVVATDGVYPTDGALAPLREYDRVSRELELGLWVDDAHGVGVLGDHGGGSPEHWGVPTRGLLYTGSLGKAFGVYGGFASGPAVLCRKVESSGAYVGATPIPPAMALAARVSLELVCAEDRGLRKRLRSNIHRMKSGLKALGLELPETPMPIARFVVGDARRSLRLHLELRRRGVLIPFNTYPGGPVGGYLRVAIFAAHSDEHIDRALDALRAAL